MDGGSQGQNYDFEQVMHTHRVFMAHIIKAIFPSVQKQYAWLDAQRENKSLCQDCTQAFDWSIYRIISFFVSPVMVLDDMDTIIFIRSASLHVKFWFGSGIRSGHHSKRGCRAWVLTKPNTRKPHRSSKCSVIGFETPITRSQTYLCHGPWWIKQGSGGIAACGFIHIEHFINRRFRVEKQLQPFSRNQNTPIWDMMWFDFQVNDRCTMFPKKDKRPTGCVGNSKTKIGSRCIYIQYRFSGHVLFTFGSNLFRVCFGMVGCYGRNTSTISLREESRMGDLQPMIFMYSHFSQLNQASI